MKNWKNWGYGVCLIIVLVMVFFTKQLIMSLKLMVLGLAAMSIPFICWYLINKFKKSEARSE